MSVATCRPTEAGYLLDGEHYDECTEAECRGCWPCVPTTGNGDPLTHCTARGRCTEHVAPEVLSCPRCVGKVRTALTDIERLHALMLPEAIVKGVESEAANLAGPADPIGWSERKVDAIRNGYQHTLEEDDPNHPLSVLGRWDMMLREDYDQPTRATITVSRSVDYLDSQLDRLAQDPEQDFPEFVRDVFGCRAHLESVLHDGRAPEQGAPCPTCPVPAPKLMLRHDDQDTTGASDKWVCPNDRSHSWTDAEYRMRVGTDYLDHSDRLTASQLQARYRIKPGTLRQWAARKQVAQRGRDESGRLLYDVAQAVAMRDKTDVVCNA